MGFAREYEQDRPFLARHQALEPAQVREEQGGTLVSREPARKTDREHVGILRIHVPQQPMNVRFAEPVARTLLNQPRAQRVQHLALR